FQRMQRRAGRESRAMLRTAVLRPRGHRRRDRGHDRDVEGRERLQSLVDRARAGAAPVAPCRPPRLSACNIPVILASYGPGFRFRGPPMPARLAAATLATVLLAAGSAGAQTIYPIDRAEILVGARFDLKVEFPGLARADGVSLTVNGADGATVFGRAATFVEREDGADQSALILRDVSLSKPGRYAVRASDGTHSAEVTWTVYATGRRPGKNVILSIGDGMSPAHRVAARLLAKGIAEGKARGKLAMDDMPHMALVATAGSDSIITDSANSASAYATGHKSA